MNITQERYSLLKLWLESFKVVGRCAGKLLGLILVSILLFTLITVLLTFTAAGGALLAMKGGQMLPQAFGIGAILIYLVFGVVSNLYAIIFCTVCWRLVANQALGEPQSLAKTFSSSMLPSLYQIAAGIIIAIPMMLVWVVAALSARISPVLPALFFLVIFFAVGIRLSYSLISIAVAGKGPIEGLTHSWKMTEGTTNYVDTLLMCLMLFASMVLVYLLFFAIGYGFFVMIPLHFANSFNLAQPSFIWILVALMLGLLALFAYFIIMAFPVLVFVNRNAVLFDVAGTNSAFIALPELELPELRPTPDHMQQAESTVRGPMLTEEDLQPTTPQVQSTTPAEEPKPATPTPQEKAQPQAMPSLEGLEVSKASINTSEKETDSLSEHLDKVYTPKKENSVQHKEEDRMPTILFDDEMAKQFSTEKQTPDTKPQNTPDNKDEGPDSVKLS